MKRTLSTLAVTIAAVIAPAVIAQESSNVSQQIDILQSQIDELKSQVEANSTKVEEASETAEVAIESVERSRSLVSTSSGVSIGGYGELHYNNLDSGSKIDFHRFVLFFGNEFTDKLRFFSELELEHAFSGEGKPGEVELEQAYIEYDFSENVSGKGGLFLIPVGIINETHEPPAFYGVERNGVEKEIIPATWWEAGAAVSGHNDAGFSYDFAVHSGLNVPTTGSNAYKIRSGRQKVAKATAEDFAFTGRVRYTGIAGLELGLTLQRQSDITQGVEDAAATLIETHVVYQAGNFGLRALFASWDVEGATAEALGKDSQYGFYIEPSYKLNQSWGFFARYGEYNTADGLSGSEAVEQFDVGANWYVHEDVVVKFDIMDQGGAKDDKGFNVGLGYQF